jgi:alpha-glucosidase
MNFTCTALPEGNGLAIHIGKHEGSYPSWWKDIAVEVNGLPSEPVSATVNGRSTRITANGRAFTLSAPDPGTGIEVVLH